MEICDNLKNLYLVSSFRSWVGFEVSFSQMDLEFHNRGRRKDNEKNVNARKTYILEY